MSLSHAHTHAHQNVLNVEFVQGPDETKQDNKKTEQSQHCNAQDANTDQNDCHWMQQWTNNPAPTTNADIVRFPPKHGFTIRRHVDHML